MAEFEIPEDDGVGGGNVALGIVLALILSGLIAGLAAYAYHRYILWVIRSYLSQILMDFAQI